MLLCQVVDWVGKSHIRQRAEVSFLLLESKSICRLVPGQAPCQKLYQEACVDILLMLARRKHDFFFRDVDSRGKQNNNNNNNNKDKDSSKPFLLSWGYWLFCHHHESFWSWYNKYLAGEKRFGLGSKGWSNLPFIWHSLCP